MVIRQSKRWVQGALKESTNPPLDSIRCDLCSVLFFDSERCRYSVLAGGGSASPRLDTGELNGSGSGHNQSKSRGEIEQIRRRCSKAWPTRRDRNAGFTRSGGYRRGVQVVRVIAQERSRQAVKMVTIEPRYYGSIEDLFKSSWFLFRFISIYTQIHNDTDFILLFPISRRPLNDEKGYYAACARASRG